MDGRDTGYDRERGGIPRWMKVIGIIVALLVLLVVIVELTGLDAGHGPSRHQQGDSDGHRPPAVHTGPGGRTWAPHGADQP
jgi:hypothetical protein